ncbi:ATP-dependent Clp protease ATP-binding subunit ClpA homolog CD4A, chloroplastic-like [Solanum verrucosum]|uniref:ATP-dependent Clp protease ATP-binding subunit ClpA homolog CD4A, chloroplastic-like n=1 Tax=Solanum verrucosum TaxID=315347 RepID=UPI0020D16EB5|nr:ATP-dependent Clp protease ATP-binding subunit ClpA homolog CD4A, chloroplastic-like [Solanum verrucosum]
MAKVLVQSISIPSSFAAGERDGQFNGSWKSVRMNSFVGLRGGNALLVKSGETLHSKVVVKRQQGFLMLAQDESRRLGHNLVGTEQIMLGLIGEETGTAAKVLKSMGINLKDARIEVEKIIGMATRVLQNLGADPNNIYLQASNLVGKSNVAIGAGVGGGTSGPSIFFFFFYDVEEDN